MIVHWRGHDLQAWDAVHASAAAALQQDWAYGSSLAMMGVHVLRARVMQDDEQLAQAQFIVRKWGRWGAVALCSRGPVWSRPLLPQQEAEAYAALKQLSLLLLTQRNGHRRLRQMSVKFKRQMRMGMQPITQLAQVAMPIRFCMEPYRMLPRQFLP